MKREKIYAYGKHALIEALLNVPHSIKKVFFTPGAVDETIEKKLADFSIPVSRFKKSENKEHFKDDSHQRVITVINPNFLLVNFVDFFSSFSFSSDTSFVLLNELSDPHNVGAIIRSAAAFGLSGVLIPNKNQAPLTGVVIKTSAGMVFRVPLISIENSVEALKNFKKFRCNIYALTMNGEKTIEEELFLKPSLFVLGNEGRGISKDLLEECSTTLRIPMHSRTESLNVSVAAALTFYEWSKKHIKVIN